MSIYEMIADEAERQMMQEGRPLLSYILSPAQVEQLREELSQNVVGLPRRGGIETFELNFQGQKEPCFIVRGP